MYKHIIIVNIQPAHCTSDECRCPYSGSVSVHTHNHTG